MSQGLAGTGLTPAPPKPPLGLAAPPNAAMTSLGSPAAGENGSAVR